MSSFYDLASLVMIPSGKKAGKVYSQKPLTTDGQLDFTRASTATRIGPTGLIEKTRTNSLLNTETFSSWALEGGALTGGFSAPDGSLTASKYVPSGSSGLFSTAMFTDSLIKTISIYVKSADGTSYSVTLGNGVNAGVITKTVTPTWQRISVSPTTTPSTMSLYLYAIGNVNGVFVWHPQGEIGTVATDYIATTSSAVSVGSVDNMPRLNYTEGSTTSCPSLLLEPQRTNLVPQSEYFNTYWSLGAISITNNYATSPEGIENASRYISPGGSYPQMAGVVLGLTVGQQYTTTFYVKSDGTNQIEQSFWINAINEVRFTPTSEWIRITHNFTATATSNTLLLFTNSGSASASSYLLYGFQMEEGSYPTSYIPTFGATVSRVADAANNLGSAAIFNDSEGVLYCEMSALAEEVVDKRIALSDGTLNNYVSIGYSRFSGNIIAEMFSGGVLQTASFGAAGVTKTNNNKFAFSWGSGTMKFYVNGIQTNTESVTSPTGMNNLRFSAADGSLPMFSNTKGLRFYKTSLSNTQLADLTSIES